MSEINEKEIKRRYEVISQFEPSREVTTRDLQQTRKKLAGKISTRQPAELKIWRTIMKSKVTKFAVAAVIIIAVSLGVHYSGDAFDGTSIVLGQTIENMKKKPWVHFKTTALESGDDILESWHGLDSGIFTSKQYKEAKLLYINDKENTEYTYKEKEGVIYYSQIDDSVRPGDYEPDSAFALVELMVDYMSKYASEVTYRTIIQDNKEIELVTATAGANEESIFNKIELTLDIGENLILSVKIDYKDIPEYMLANVPEEIREQRRNSRIDTITIFDYPTTGPSSIYDLGVPPGIEIVYSYLPEEIEDLIQKLNDLRQTNLTEYVAVSLPADIDQLPTSFDDRRPERYFTVNDYLVSSIWRKGDERFHSRGYYENSDNMPNLENFSGNIQSCAELIMGVTSNIYKADRIYHYQILNDKSVRSIRKGEVEIYGREVFIEQICWPQIVVPRYRPMQWKLESVVGENNDELILIERNTGGFKDKWFLDPAHDYICRKYEHAHSDGRPIETIEILGYAHTQSGQLYPRILQKTVNEYLNGKEQQLTFSRIIFLEETPDFPDGIFDPANLPKADE
jgi:hypothetical protein